MSKLLLSQVSSVEHIVKKLNDVTRKTVDPGAETLISQALPSPYPLTLANLFPN